MLTFKYINYLCLTVLCGVLFYQPAHAIRDGYDARSTHPSTLRWNRYNDPGLSCTATVVAPQILITAGHCVIQMREPSSISLNNSKYTVLAYFTHPYLPEDFGLSSREKSPAFAAYDFTIIVLKQQIRDIPVADLGAIRTTTAQLVGAGPTKKILHNPRESQPNISHSPHYTNISVRNSKYSGLIIGDHSLEKKIACPGDSGGGLYQDGVLTGLLSARFYVGSKNGKKKKVPRRKNNIGCEDGLVNSLIVDLKGYLKPIHFVQQNLYQLESLNQEMIFLQKP